MHSEEATPQVSHSMESSSVSGETNGKKHQTGKEIGIQKRQVESILFGGEPVEIVDSGILRIKKQLYVILSDFLRDHTTAITSLRGGVKHLGSFAKSLTESMGPTDRRNVQRQNSIEMTVYKFETVSALLHEKNITIHETVQETIEPKESEPQEAAPLVKRYRTQRLALEEWDNTADQKPPDHFKPTDAVPGSAEKLEVLARRVELGLPLWHEKDRKDYSKRSSEDD